MELPKATTDALLSIYVSVLDDLIPLVDGPTVFRDYSNGQSSRYLVMGMCLVTCKANQAAPFLRLSEDGPVLHPFQFGSKLLGGLDAAIKADLEPDKVVKIQVLAMMHLHNDGISGMDRSARFLSQALCESWALSIHCGVPGNEDQEQTDYLWWTLRNLDRLNKPVMGATPFMVDDTDIALKRIPPRKDSYRSQLMHVSLALGDLMARATKLYKATSTATEDDDEDYPSLAEVTHGVDTQRFHKSHREYLEIWYHVTAVLSCLHSGPGKKQYDRRLDSAESILGILSGQSMQDSMPLPLIPYAMSVSTCVIYRALRDGTRSREVAYRDLGRCCQVLDLLSQRWTSAKGMAKLSRRLLAIPKPAATTGSAQDRNEVRRSKRQKKDSRSSVTSNISSHQTQVPAPPTCIPNPDISLQPDVGFGTPYTSETGDFSNWLQLPLDSWDGSDGSFSHWDSMFGGMFDHTLPNAFRKPWEYFNLGADEENLPSITE